MATSKSDDKGEKKARAPRKPRPLFVVHEVGHAPIAISRNPMTAMKAFKNAPEGTSLDITEIESVD